MRALIVFWKRLRHAMGWDVTFRDGQWLRDGKPLSAEEQGKAYEWWATR
jgi:hypothetical protein